MLSRTSAFRRWAHLSLLLAAILQIAGVSAGPWAHLSDREGVPARVAGAPAQEDPSGTAPHDELSCFVCQALGAVGLPGADPALPGARITAAPPEPSAESVRPLLRTSIPQARSPPSA